MESWGGDTPHIKKMKQIKTLKKLLEMNLISPACFSVGCYMIGESRINFKSVSGLLNIHVATVRRCFGRMTEIELIKITHNGHWKEYKFTTKKLEHFTNTIRGVAVEKQSICMGEGKNEKSTCDNDNLSNIKKLQASYNRFQKTNPVLSITLTQFFDDRISLIERIYKHLNDVAGTRRSAYKTDGRLSDECIKLNEHIDYMIDLGHRIDEIETIWKGIIDIKKKHADDKDNFFSIKYLRPSTLWGKTWDGNKKGNGISEYYNQYLMNKNKVDEDGMTEDKLKAMYEKWENDNS